MNISASRRTKRLMPWKLVEFIWKKNHEKILWQSMINCLKEVAFRNDIEHFNDYVLFNASYRI